MSVCIYGERHSGSDVRGSNVTAVTAIANILKTSLGPQGLDKMIVDDIGDICITNDGATILKKLEVQHPAAKILVDLSQLQDQEVGDGTTSVVLLAAELLKQSQYMIKEGIHPTSIVAGYKLAMKEAVKYIKDNLSIKLEHIGPQALHNIASTTLNSKFISAESSQFADIVVQAIQTVKMTTESGAVKYPVGAVSIVKTHGLSCAESELAHGYVIKTGRAAQGMPMMIKDAKIALLDINLRQHRMQLGVSVQITNPKELEMIRQKERDITKQRIQLILASGANVVMTSQGVDDPSLKYFVEKGVLAIRRVAKQDLKRIAKLTGGSVCYSLATLEGDEKFDPSYLGSCECVFEKFIGDYDHIFIQSSKRQKAATIILRGANEQMLDEIERSVHDALCAVSRACEFNSVCPGGGAAEVALSIYLEDFARTLGSREQLAVAAFSQSLLVIPRTLSSNAVQDCSDLLAKLRAYHAKAQSASIDSTAETDYKWYGLDLLKGRVRNSIQAGVIEAVVSKVKSIRFATEAAITILRIDDLIKLSPEAERNPHE